MAKTLTNILLLLPGIAAICYATITSLTHGGGALEASHTAISSIADTWLLVKAIETNGERTRGIEQDGLTSGAIQVAGKKFAHHHCGFVRRAAAQILNRSR